MKTTLNYIRQCIAAFIFVVGVHFLISGGLLIAGPLAGWPVSIWTAATMLFGSIGGILLLWHLAKLVPKRPEFDVESTSPHIGRFGLPILLGIAFSWQLGLVDKVEVISYKGKKPIYTHILTQNWVSLPLPNHAFRIDGLPYGTVLKNEGAEEYRWEFDVTDPDMRKALQEAAQKGIALELTAQTLAAINEVLSLPAPEEPWNFNASVCAHFTVKFDMPPPCPTVVVKKAPPNFNYPTVATVKI